METQRPGKIINISSVHEELPSRDIFYFTGASKGGVKNDDAAWQLSQMGLPI